MKELWKRVLLPASIPVVALAIIVFSVLNISRVLIAVEESNSPGLTTLLASLIAAAVLFSCVYFSSREAERRQHNTGAIMAMSGVLLLVSGLWGYQAIEHRENAEHGDEPADVGPADLVVHAFDLGFEEKTLSAAPGDLVVEYVNNGTQAHTLVFEGGIPGKLEVGSKGQTDKGAFPITEAGEYVYFCDLAGHREAGMEGILTVGEGAGGAAGGGATDVTVGNNLSFEPAEITGAPGPLKINMKLAGSLPHTLVIEGVAEFKKLEVAKDGDVATGTFDAKPGEYVFFCDVPGHRQAGMEGKIKIA